MISFLVYTQILILGILYSVPAILFALLYSVIVCFRKQKVHRMMRRAILGLGKLTVKCAIRPWVRVVTEQEHTAGSRPERAVYICNHRSASDAFLVSEIKTSRPAFQVMKGWPMRLPVLGQCARAGGYFSITGLAYEEILERCRELLVAEKAPVFVYPEGTRSGSREIGQFHGTFFRIAKDLELPIVPVAIAGNEKIPDLSFRIHPGLIRIKVLDTIDVQTVRELSLYKLKSLVREKLSQELAQLDERLSQHD